MSHDRFVNRHIGPREEEIREMLKTKTVPVCLGWTENTEFKNDPNIFRGDWEEVTDYLISRA